MFERESIDLPPRSLFKNSKKKEYLDFKNPYIDNNQPLLIVANSAGLEQEKVSARYQLYDIWYTNLNPSYIKLY